MKSEFRETCPPDSPAVAAFLQRVFDINPSLPVIEPRHLHWKCWEQRPDWPGSRGYVLAHGDSIVAHGTVVPLSCVSGQGRLKMAHVIDWAADPASVGGGVRIMNRIVQMVDAVVAVGGSQMTQKALPALGAKVCGEVTRFALPLRPSRWLAGQKLSWRSWAKFGRSLLWSLGAPSMRTPGWTVSRVMEDRLDSTALPWPRATEGITIFERTAEAMAYFLRCPAAPMALFSVAKDGIVRGYFLLASAPGQARIADFYIDSDTREDWRILIQLAVAQAKRDPAVAEVVSVSSDPVTRQALLDSGFHARGDSPLRLLARKGVELPVGPIRFHMIDSDAAYLHENKNDYWA